MKRANAWTSALTPGDGDERHGHSGYKNLDCRCDICRAANSAYNLSARRVRAQRLALDPTLRPHGIYTTYLNWGCRCADCRRANNEQRRKAS